MNYLSPYILQSFVKRAYSQGGYESAPQGFIPRALTAASYGADVSNAIKAPATISHNIGQLKALGTASNVAKAGAGTLARRAPIIGTALDAFNTYSNASTMSNNAQQNGGWDNYKKTEGYQRDLNNTVTSAVPLAGAAIGAGIGSAFGGVGAIPGAIIGGTVGGVYQLGKNTYDWTKDKLTGFNTDKYNAASQINNSLPSSSSGQYTMDLLDKSKNQGSFGSNKLFGGSTNMADVAGNDYLKSQVTAGG